MRFFWCCCLEKHLTGHPFRDTCDRGPFCGGVGRTFGVGLLPPVGWLIGWVAGSLASWLVGWLAGSLVGWLAGWLVGFTKMVPKNVSPKRLKEVLASWDSASLRRGWESFQLNSLNGLIPRVQSSFCTCHSLRRWLEPGFRSCALRTRIALTSLVRS